MGRSGEAATSEGDAATDMGGFTATILAWRYASSFSVAARAARGNTVWFPPRRRILPF